MILITMPVIGLPVPVRGRAPAAVAFPAAEAAAVVRIEVPGRGAVAMVCVSKISSAIGGKHERMCII